MEEKTEIRIENEEWGSEEVEEILENTESSGLEHLIKSERYTLKGFLGRGCWGKVAHYWDTVMKEDVAIKVMAPGLTAEKQMLYRQLNEFEAMRKEGGKLTACANIVPRRFELDEEGKPFIVMPKYDTFLSEILDAAQESKNTRHVFVGDRKATILKSGLAIDEVIDYSEHIVNGIAEIHEIYAKAHCDLKPDNLAVDKRGKVLISDMGTSTYASIAIGVAPRDNMGFLYTRSPRLFLEGEHPEKSADVFSFGCLLYKMFTGKYPLQDEIDKTMGKGGFEKLKDYMKEFYSKSEYSNATLKHFGNIRRTIDEKLAREYEIPFEFAEIIRDCFCETDNAADASGLGENAHSFDGKDLKKKFEKAVKAYNERMVERRAIDQLKSNIKKKIFVGVPTGIGIACAIGAFAWLAYISPKPDYTSKTDIISRIQVRPVEKSEVLLEVDKPYNINELVVFGKKTHNYKYLEEGHNFRVVKSKKENLVYKIVTEWIKTANETGTPAEPIDYIIKYANLHPSNATSGVIYADDKIEDLLACAIDLSQIDESKGLIDFEDAIVHTYLGDPMKDAAIRAANSNKFSDYVDAKDRDGKHIIPEERRIFLKRLMYNLYNHPEISKRIVVNGNRHNYSASQESSQDTHSK
ncbi:hypothetical protein AYK26_01435 [Euryarchaeota archaeon SM23-78]|nr:MAG: hypothetical protein AYK26_01435 [Euryarchaeota archaeon SM23-78]MBW3000471.1 protein kinase [Candidatus Woesearchaeota archaeon]